jgi:hypothetical protein
MRPKADTLTGQELEIMKVIWPRGQATVREVYNDLRTRRTIAYTSADDDERPRNQGAGAYRGGTCTPGVERQDGCFRASPSSRRDLARIIGLTRGGFCNVRSATLLKHCHRRSNAVW